MRLILASSGLRMTPVAMSWASVATRPTTESPGPRTSRMPRTTTIAAGDAWGAATG